VVAATKRFAFYTVNLNQNNRINKFMTQMQSKFVKAPTIFQTAVTVLDDATGNGSTCNAGPANSTITSLYRTLQNCSSTAARLCDMRLRPADNETVTKCNPLLSGYIRDFQVIGIRVNAFTIFLLFYSFLYANLSSSQHIRCTLRPY
jgi:hypothetical protein